MNFHKLNTHTHTPPNAECDFCSLNSLERQSRGAEITTQADLKSEDQPSHNLVTFQ